MLIRSNGEIIRINAFRVKNNYGIFNIFDEIKVSRVPL